MPLPFPKSRAEIEAIQRDRKQVAFKRAKQAPFHQKRLKGIDPARLDDPEEWGKIPIMDKEQLRAIAPERFNEQFCIVPKEQIAELWRSGGSSGVPLFYPRSFDDLPYCILSFARSVQLAGATAGDTAHISFPLGIHPVGHAYARAAQLLGIGVNWAGAGNSTPSAMQIELIDRLQPTLWMGMSSYGIHLANLAEARGIDLAANSVQRIMCTAEPLSQAKRDKIGRMWGAEVQDNFGMTEAGLMGGESEARDGFHIWSDMFFIEVVDEASGGPVADGEPGLLVVTPLWTNHATPFLRWNSGDVVTYREHGATQGPYSVFPVIRHAHRTVGFFKIRGISLNHREVEDFMFRHAAVIDFKAEVITENDREVLRLSVELMRSSDLEAVIRQVTGDFRNTFELTPEVVVLERGTLATEFEASLKAPRFVDRRV